MKTIEKNKIKQKYHEELYSFLSGQDKLYRNIAAEAHTHPLIHDTFFYLIKF